MESLHDSKIAHRDHEPGWVERVSPLRAATVNRRVLVFPDGAHGVTCPTSRFMESFDLQIRTRTGAMNPPIGAHRHFADHFLIQTPK